MSKSHSTQSGAGEKPKFHSARFRRTRNCRGSGRQALATHSLPDLPKCGGSNLPVRISAFGERAMLGKVVLGIHRIEWHGDMGQARQITILAVAGDAVQTCIRATDILA